MKSYLAVITINQIEPGTVDHAQSVLDNDTKTRHYTVKVLKELKEDELLRTPTEK